HPAPHRPARRADPPGDRSGCGVGWRDEGVAGVTMDTVASEATRCAWARTPLGIAYHDLEWGVPVHDDRVLFEFITLEGAQAGLSWETILRKRDAYRKAFRGF